MGIPLTMAGCGSPICAPGHISAQVVPKSPLQGALRHPKASALIPIFSFDAERLSGNQLYSRFRLLRASMDIEYVSNDCLAALAGDVREALRQVVCEAMPGEPTEPFHYMVWGMNAGDGRQSDETHLAVLRDYAVNLASALTPGMDVISVRVLFAPPGCPAQPFHLDYAQHFSEVRTIFVSVSPSTASNCTECLMFGEMNSDVAARARQLVQKGMVVELSQICDCKPVVQPLVLDAWQTCILRTSNVFHRRSPNRSDFTRITFNVDVARVRECPEFVDVDTRRSLGHQRICGREVVDALDEQDICLHGFCE